MKDFEKVKGNYYSVFSLRINENLMKDIKKSAIKNKRSINKHIEFILQDYIDKEK